MALHYDYNDVKKELNYPDCMDFSLRLFQPPNKNQKALPAMIYDPRLDDPDVLAARDKKHIARLMDEIERNERKLLRPLVKRAQIECRKQIREAKTMLLILQDKSYVDTGEIPGTL
jgi:hypothetical protein